jgi:hypothetical protein
MVRSFKSHGQSETRLYGIWQNMRARCFNKKDPHYKNYGGRGITVCKEWEDFETFQYHMGMDYADGLTLDRIDNNDDYRAENCRWRTPEFQSKHKRNIKYIDISGVLFTAGDLGRIYGLDRGTLQSRLRNGWTLEHALSVPLHQVKRYKRITSPM